MNVLLVVENDQDFGSVALGALSKLGHSVTHVPTVEEALWLIDNYRFDAVVSDCEFGSNVIARVQQKNPLAVTIMVGDKTYASWRETVVADHVLGKNVKQLVTTISAHEFEVYDYE
jgi:DNA-binding NtrC family response regulator